VAAAVGVVAAVAVKSITPIRSVGCLRVLSTSVCQLPETVVQRFPNCGPRTTGGPRVLPLWSS
jgi:hypothetical protein